MKISARPKEAACILPGKIVQASELQTGYSAVIMTDKNMLNSLVPVALTACSGYEDLSQALDRVLEQIAFPVNLQGSEVLLKPNLISAKSGSLPCTEGRLILAAARRFLDLGARVGIGDSPAFGTAASVLDKLGLLEELAYLGVQVRSFHQGLSVELPGKGRATLARAALECDLLVNLPRVKAHDQARLTMAVKNYFGCLVGLRKAWWHMAYGGRRSSKKDGFFDRIIRLPDALPPSVSIIDGIRAMHRRGPVHGLPYPLAVLAAAGNPVAADRALQIILKVAPQDCPLMAACRRAGRAGARAAQLSFPLAAPEELQVDDFQVPAVLNPVRFNPFRFVLSTARRMLMSRTKAV